MFCAISGVTPEEPVVSAKSGLLYEKRLALKLVAEAAHEPGQQDALVADDLVEIKPGGAVKPRPPTATSVPGLLSLFHNEWDATMLETHALREQLHSSRQELAHALYTHDAAMRVIARLKMERDEARAALASEPAQASKRTMDGDAMEMDTQGGKKAKAGITSDVVDTMTALSKELSKWRKKRPAQPSLATPEALASYTCLSSQPLHKTSPAGIAACDLMPNRPTVVATAGNDGQVIVFDRATGKLGAALTGHSKRVNAVTFAPKHPHVLVSGGHDKTTKVWRASAGSGADSVQLDEFKLTATLKDHAGEVTAVCAHPTSQYMVTASADKSWAFYDLEAALCLTQVTDSSMTGGYTCAAFHPDGLILGTGTTENLVRIWDIKSQDNVAKFEGHTAAVTGLSFSENGYHLATCAADGVKLWDLRKVKVFKTLTPYDGAPTAAVKFDTSGLYLGVGGVDARVYGVKQDWEVVATYTDIKKAATALAWTPDAKELLVCSMDRNLRTYGTK